MRRIHPLSWLTVFAVVIGVVAGAWVIWRSPRKDVVPVAPPERLRSELELRDGVFYLAGTPFDGFVIERHDNGQLKSRSTVSNGVLQGLSEGWHANGMPQIVETYVAGVSHGIRTKFYESGAKLSSVIVSDGQTQGVFERWFENGFLSERVQLTNGVAHGESLAFHPDGSLKARVQMNQGNVVNHQFWEPGQEWLPGSHIGEER